MRIREPEKKISLVAYSCPPKRGRHQSKLLADMACKADDGARVMFAEYLSFEREAQAQQDKQVCVCVCVYVLLCTCLDL